MPFAMVTVGQRRASSGEAARFHQGTGIDSPSQGVARMRRSGRGLMAFAITAWSTMVPPWLCPSTTSGPPGVMARAHATTAPRSEAYWSKRST